MGRARTYEERLAHPRIMGNLSRGRSTTHAFVMEIQGANVLMEYLAGLEGIWGTFFPSLLDVAADMGIEEARKRVPVETGATRDSINKHPGVWSKPERGEWSVRFGPTTFYSPWLEYGTIKMAPRPFMHPAGDLAGAVMVQSTIAMVNMLTGTGGMMRGGGGGGSALADNRMSRSITDARSFLYSTSKFLGDIAVFTGRDFFGPVRATMMGLAQGLGDVSSLMNATVSQRVSTRLRGRVTGRIVGYGSATLSGGFTYSSFVGGSVGHRIYQRAAGRYTNPGFSLTNLGM